MRFAAPKTVPIPGSDADQSRLCLWRSPASSWLRWSLALLLSAPISRGSTSTRSARAAADPRPDENPQTPELAAPRQKAAEAEQALTARPTKYEASREVLTQSVRCLRALELQQTADQAVPVRTIRAGNVSADVRRTWSMYLNGQIPAAALGPLAMPGHIPPAGAALAFEWLAEAYRQAFRWSLGLTDSDRSDGARVPVYQQKPSLPAVPCTSNHGSGLAVDLCGGVETSGAPEHAWMHASAARYGEYHPRWPEPDGSGPKPWRWEYDGAT